MDSVIQPYSFQCKDQKTLTIATCLSHLLLLEPLNMLYRRQGKITFTNYDVLTIEIFINYRSLKSSIGISRETIQELKQKWLTQLDNATVYTVRELHEICDYSLAYWHLNCCIIRICLIELRNFF